MALTACQECGAQVSDKALACPTCGCPFRQPSILSMNLGIDGGVLKILICVGLFLGFISLWWGWLLAGAAMLALLIRSLK